MKFSIGVIWSSNIDNKPKYPDNIIIYDNIKMIDANAVLSKLLKINVDAIVVTAGIANILDKNVKLPIIIGYPNYIDILETLDFIENKCGITGEKIGIILQKNNPFKIEKIIPFSRNYLNLILFDDFTQLDSIVYRLREENYYGIIAGPTAEQIGSKLGLKAYPLAFDSKIFEDALEKAKSIIFHSRREGLLSTKLETITNMSQDGLIVTDNNGDINFYNQQVSRLLNAEEDIHGKNINIIFDKLKFSSSDRTKLEAFVEYNNNKYFMMKQDIKIDDENYGQVIRFEEISKIQHIEQKYRNIQNLGLVARYSFDDIIYQSKKVQDVIEIGKASSVYDYTVLIFGETGTGKEMFAQSIHNESKRKNEPFVAINCAAIAETLLESELFGYDDGAFTGAKKGGKIGLFERAHKGTIFLDEISQMSLSIQAKVLRVIQEKSIMRIGSDRVIPIDVRIIAATNERLYEKVKKNEFRSDLYYRLSVIELELPALRERREDIPLLIDYFLKKFNDKYNEDKSISQEDIHRMSQMNWPGNIRELENYIIRLCIMKQLRTSDYKEKSSDEDNYANDGYILLKIDSLKVMEKQLIEKVLSECGGNKTLAGKILNVNRNTIKQKLID